MQAMTMKKKIAVTGTGLFTASLCALPLAGSASAASITPAGNIGDNDAINVQTDYDCTTHSLNTEVKNKLGTDISPTVTFDKKQPSNMGGTPDVPIKSGDTRTYTYDTSGNNMSIPVTVAVDGYNTVEVDPTVHCSEPVTFKITDYSNKTVVGNLTNNNSTYPQTVTLSAGLNGAQQTVTLQPNETTLVSVPFTGFPDQTGVSVSVSNGPDYEGTYYVDLTQPPQSPIRPLAHKQ
jgi:hypothetical protein